MDKRLLSQAKSICKEMGMDTQEAARLFLAAVVHRCELLFKGTTETPENKLLQQQARRAEILYSFYADGSQARFIGFPEGDHIPAYQE